MRSANPPLPMADLARERDPRDASEVRPVPPRLYLLAPTVEKAHGTAFELVSRTAESARSMGATVDIYVSSRFSPDDEPRAANFHADLGGPEDLARIAPEPDATDEPPSRTTRLQVLALARSYHVRDGLAALFTLSVPPRSQPFVRRVLRVIRAFAAASAAAVLAVPTIIKGIGPFLLDLPRIARNAVVGPRVSVEPFSPLAKQIAALLDGKSDEVPDVIAVVTDDPSALDGLIDLEFLAPQWRGQVGLVLFSTDKEERWFHDTIDPDRLGGRLNTSTLSDRLAIFEDLPERRQRLDDMLGRPVLPLAEISDALLTIRQNAVDGGEMVRPLAAVVRPQWLFCGSNMVFANQIEFLVERGYCVLEIVVNDLFLGKRGPSALTHHVLSQYRGSRAHRTLVLNMKVGLVPWFGVLTRYGRRFFRSSLAMRAACLELAEVPDSLAKVLAARSAEIVVVNHCFNMKVARKIFPRSPLVLESHDIQAEQSRLRNLVSGSAAEAYNMDLATADEIDLMSAASWVVSLNEEETRFFEQSPKIQGVTTIHPYLIAESGGLVNGQPYPGPSSQLLGASDPIEAVGAIDVLLIASSHAANIVSTEWFIDKVFIPHLSDRPVNVTVVGAIADAVSHSHPRLHFTGQVPRVEPYYKAAKVVALPITSGAGIPIKTLEALALGKAVAVTPAALRGLTHNGTDNLPAYDDPKALADDILNLVADPEAREERERTGLAIAARNYSREDYFGRWDDVVAQVTARGEAGGPRPSS